MLCSGNLWDLVMVVAQNLFSIQYKNIYVRPLVVYIEDINIFNVENKLQ